MQSKNHIIYLDRNNLGVMFFLIFILYEEYIMNIYLRSLRFETKQLHHSYKHSYNSKFTNLNCLDGIQSDIVCAVEGESDNIEGQEIKIQTDHANRWKTKKVKFYKG